MAPTSKRGPAVAEREDGVTALLRQELADELAKAQRLTADLEAKLGPKPVAAAPKTEFWHPCPATGWADEKGRLVPEGTKKAVKIEVCKTPQFWDTTEPADNYCAECGFNPGPEWVLERAVSNHGMAEVKPLVTAKPDRAVKSPGLARNIEHLRTIARATLRDGGVYEQEITTPDLILD